MSAERPIPIDQLRLMARTHQKVIDYHNFVLERLKPADEERSRIVEYIRREEQALAENLMARQIVQPWFRRDDFETMSKLVLDAPDLVVHTFDEWELQANKEVARLEGLGFHVIKAIVDANEFIDWCKTSKERHDFLSLTAFAMAQAAATKVTGVQLG
jgi:hypothetical protein